MLHPHELGLVKEGYFADLLLVSGDVEKDVSVLDSGKGVEMVMIVSNRLFSGIEMTDRMGRSISLIRRCNFSTGETRPLRRRRDDVYIVALVQI